MKIIKLILAILFGVFLIMGGINHFRDPNSYNQMIPDFLPKLALNYITGVIELVLGIGVIIPRYRHMSALGIMILMIVFLPIHVWEIFRDDPAIGSHTTALIRLPIQFVLIAWAWFLSKK
jgi:uncharacterized membrane protein